MKRPRGMATTAARENPMIVVDDARIDRKHPLTSMVCLMPLADILGIPTGTRMMMIARSGTAAQKT